ncbi:MAG TPA: NAD(P)-dependent oxidoreductase [Opitutae bacterium]|nr:nucleoside-diphosphate sugar epimerase [Opitutaceae bacterium]HCR28689.1 NAD(P)-dependent oxidoreductase [Opitutae bacterium]
MKILITGSSGRIGRTVTSILLNRGDDVVGFDAVSSPISHENFTGIVSDFSDTAALSQASDGVDAILHLGAFMSWKKEDQQKIFEANVTGTLNILAAAVESGARKIVFASSGEVYPDRKPEYLPIDEKHPTNPTSPYGLSKLMAEEAVRFYERVHHLPSVILRFSHTQDASELLDQNSFFSGSRFYLHAKIRQQREFGNHQLADLLETYKDGNNKLVVSCNEDGQPHCMGISDTRDTVAGVIAALDSDLAAGNAYNLAPPSATSFDQAIDCLKVATGLESIRINIPGPDLNYESDCEKAKENLGYQPKWTFERMVEDAVRQRDAK